MPETQVLLLAIALDLTVVRLSTASVEKFRLKRKSFPYLAKNLAPVKIPQEPDFCWIGRKGWISVGARIQYSPTFRDTLYTVIIKMVKIAFLTHTASNMTTADLLLFL